MAKKNQNGISQQTVDDDVQYLENVPAVVTPRIKSPRQNLMSQLTTAATNATTVSPASLKTTPSPIQTPSVLPSTQKIAGRNSMQVSPSSFLYGQNNQQNQQSQLNQPAQNSFFGVKRPNSLYGNREPEQDFFNNGPQPTKLNITPRIDTSTASGMEAYIWNNYAGKARDDQYAMLDAAYSTYGSPYYSPYRKVTNSAYIDQLKSYGIDVPSTITAGWLESAGAALEQYLNRSTATGAPKSPGSNASPAEQAAYILYQMRTDELSTQKAEKEWAELRDQVTYWTKKGLSDREIKAKINMDKFPTLKSMDESLYTGKVNGYNRVIGYSQDAIDGVIWKARNAGFDDTDDFTAAVYSKMHSGVGDRNSWRSVSSRIPGNENYMPYNSGCTNDDARRYFGMDSFDWETIRYLQQKAYLEGDTTAQGFIDELARHANDTDNAKSELDTLWSKVMTWDYTSDITLGEDETLEDYFGRKLDAWLEKKGKTLKSMDDYRLRGSYLPLNESVNYRKEDIIDYMTHQYLKTHDMTMSPKEAIAEARANSVTAQAAAGKTGDNSGMDGLNRGVQTILRDIVGVSAPQDENQTGEQTESTPSPTQSTIEAMAASSGVALNNGAHVGPKADPRRVDALEARLGDILTQAEEQNGKIRITPETGVPKAPEKVDVAKEANNLLVKGSKVDIGNRTPIDASKLAKAGWEDPGEGYATLYSMTVGIGGENNQMNALITPIKADGTVLSPKEFDAYTAKFDDCKTVEDVLKQDTQGLILDVDSANWDDEASIEKLNDKAEALHTLSDQVEQEKLQQSQPEQAAPEVAQEPEVVQAPESDEEEEEELSLSSLENDFSGNLTGEFDPEHNYAHVDYDTAYAALRKGFAGNALDEKEQEQLDLIEALVPGVFGNSDRLGLQSQSATLGGYNDQLAWALEELTSDIGSTNDMAQIVLQLVNDAEIAQQNGMKLAEYYNGGISRTNDLVELLHTVDERQRQQVIANRMSEDAKKKMYVDRVTSIIEKGASGASLTPEEAKIAQDLLVNDKEVKDILGSNANVGYVNEWCHPMAVDAKVSDYVKTAREETEQVNGAGDYYFDEKAWLTYGNGIADQMRKDLAQVAKIANAAGLTLGQFYEKYPEYNMSFDDRWKVAKAEYDAKTSLENMTTEDLEYANKGLGWLKTAVAAVSGAEADVLEGSVGFVSDVLDYTLGNTMTLRRQYMTRNNGNQVKAAQNYLSDLLNYAYALSANGDTEKAGKITSAITQAKVSGESIFTVGISIDQQLVEDFNKRTFKQWETNIDNAVYSQGTEDEIFWYEAGKSGISSAIKMGAAAALRATGVPLIVSSPVAFFGGTYHATYESERANGVDKKNAALNSALVAATDSITEMPFVALGYNFFAEGTHGFGTMIGKIGEGILKRVGPGITLSNLAKRVAAGVAFWAETGIIEGSQEVGQDIIGGTLLKTLHKTQAGKWSEPKTPEAEYNGPVDLLRFGAVNTNTKPYFRNLTFSESMNELVGSAIDAVGETFKPENLAQVWLSTIIATTISGGIGTAIGTKAGNPTPIARGQTIQNYYAEQEKIENLRKTGEQLAERLAEQTSNATNVDESALTDEQRTAAADLKADIDGMISGENTAWNANNTQIFEDEQDGQARLRQNVMQKAEALFSENNKQGERMRRRTFSTLMSDIYEAGGDITEDVVGLLWEDLQNGDYGSALRTIGELVPQAETVSSAQIGPWNADNTQIFDESGEQQELPPEQIPSWNEGNVQVFEDESQPEQIPSWNEGNVQVFEDEEEELGLDSLENQFPNNFASQPEQATQEQTQPEQTLQANPLEIVDSAGNQWNIVGFRGGYVLLDRADGTGGRLSYNLNNLKGLMSEDQAKKVKAVQNVFLQTGALPQAQPQAAPAPASPQTAPAPVNPQAAAQPAQPVQNPSGVQQTVSQARAVLDNALKNLAPLTSAVDAGMVKLDLINDLMDEIGDIVTYADSGTLTKPQITDFVKRVLAAEAIHEGLTSIDESVATRWASDIEGIFQGETADPVRLSEILSEIAFDLNGMYNQVSAEVNETASSAQNYAVMQVLKACLVHAYENPEAFATMRQQLIDKLNGTSEAAGALVTTPEAQKALGTATEAQQKADEEQEKVDKASAAESAAKQNFIDKHQQASTNPKAATDAANAAVNATKARQDAEESRDKAQAEADKAKEDASSVVAQNRTQLNSENEAVADEQLQVEAADVAANTAEEDEAPQPIQGTQYHPLGLQNQEEHDNNKAEAESIADMDDTTAEQQSAFVEDNQEGLNPAQTEQEMLDKISESLKGVKEEKEGSKRKSRVLTDAQIKKVMGAVEADPELGAALASAESLADAAKAVQPEVAKKGKANTFNIRQILRKAVGLNEITVESQEEQKPKRKRKNSKALGRTIDEAADPESAQKQEGVFDVLESSAPQAENTQADESSETDQDNEESDEDEEEQDFGPFTREEAEELSIAVQSKARFAAWFNNLNDQLEADNFKEIQTKINYGREVWNRLHPEDPVPSIWDMLNKARQDSAEEASAPQPTQEEQGVKTRAEERLKRMEEILADLQNYPSNFDYSEVGQEAFRSKRWIELLTRKYDFGEEYSRRANELWEQIKAYEPHEDTSTAPVEEQSAPAEEQQTSSEETTEEAEIPRMTIENRDDVYSLAENAVRQYNTTGDYTGVRELFRAIFEWNDQHPDDTIEGHEGDDDILIDDEDYTLISGDNRVIKDVLDSWTNGHFYESYADLIKSYYTMANKKSIVDEINKRLGRDPQNEITWDRVKETAELFDNTRLPVNNYTREQYEADSRREIEEMIARDEEQRKAKEAEQAAAEKAKAEEAAAKERARTSRPDITHGQNTRPVNSVDMSDNRDALKELSKGTTALKNSGKLDLAWAKRIIQSFHTFIETSQRGSSGPIWNYGQDKDGLGNTDRQGRWAKESTAYLTAADTIAKNLGLDLKSMGIDLKALKTDLKNAANAWDSWNENIHNNASYTSVHDVLDPEAEPGLRQAFADAFRTYGENLKALESALTDAIWGKAEEEPAAELPKPEVKPQETTEQRKANAEPSRLDRNQRIQELNQKYKGSELGDQVQALMNLYGKFKNNDVILDQQYTRDLIEDTKEALDLIYDVLLNKDSAGNQRSGYDELSDAITLAAKLLDAAANLQKTFIFSAAGNINYTDQYNKLGTQFNKALSDLLANRNALRGLDKNSPEYKALAFQNRQLLASMNAISNQFMGAVNHNEALSNLERELADWQYYKDKNDKAKAEPTKHSAKGQLPNYQRPNNGQKGPFRSPVQVFNTLTKDLGIGNYNEHKPTPMTRSVSEGERGYYQAVGDYVVMGNRSSGEQSAGLHEISHAVMQRTGFAASDQDVEYLKNSLTAVYPEFYDFLDQYDDAEKPGEIRAEFMRMWLQNPEQAAYVFGDDYINDFEKALQKQKDIWKPLKKALSDIRSYAAAPAGEQVDSRVVRSRHDDRLSVYEQGILRWSKMAAKGLLTGKYSFGDITRSFSTGVIADDDAARAFDRASTGENGEKSQVQQWIRMLKFFDRTGNINLTERMTDGTGVTVNDVGLSQAMNRDLDTNEVLINNEDDYALFERYALAKIAAERYREGLRLAEKEIDKLGLDEFNPADAEEIARIRHEATQAKTVFGDDISIEQLQDIIDDVEVNHPNIAKSHQQAMDWWHQFMDVWFPLMGVSEETIQKLQQKYPSYIPTKRDILDANIDFDLWHVKGSTLDIVTPFVTMQENVMGVIYKAYRNRIAKEVYDALMRQEGDNSIDLGEYAVLLPDDVSPGASAVNEGKVINYKDGDGASHYIEIRDDLLGEVLAESQGNAGEILNTLGKFTRTMAMFTTGMNARFSLKNFMRDFQKSVNYGSWASWYGSGIVKWALAASEVLRDTETHKLYMNLGGGGFNMFGNASTEHDANQLIRNVLPNYGNDTKVGRTAERAAKLAKGIFTMNKLNEVIEQTSRYAEFRFGKHDLSTPEGRMEAFLAAQDATVDFARRGNSDFAAAMRKIIPFWNASIQGQFQNLEMFTQEERDRLAPRLAKHIVNNMLTGAMAWAILNMFGDDEDKDWYEKLSDEIKWDNIILPFMDNKEHRRRYLRMPLAQDFYAKTFYQVGRLLMDYRIGGEVSLDLAGFIQHVIGDSFKSDPVWQPYLDVLMNKNYYGGQQIPDYLLEKNIDEQFVDTTPEIFIQMSRALKAAGIEIAPVHLQYLTEQYSGFLGQNLIPLISPDKLDPEKEGLHWDQLVRSFENSFTIDPAYTNDVNNAYYAGKKMLEQIKGANGVYSSHLSTDLSDSELQLAVDEASQLLGTSGAIAHIDAQTRALRDQMAKIAEDPNFNTNQKEIMRRNIMQQIINLESEGLKYISEYQDRYCGNKNVIQTVFGYHRVQPSASALTKYPIQLIQAAYDGDRGMELMNELYTDSDYTSPTMTSTYYDEDGTKYTLKGMVDDDGNSVMSMYGDEWMKGYQEAWKDWGPDIETAMRRNDTESKEEADDLFRQIFKDANEYAKEWLEDYLGKDLTTSKPRN